MTLPPPDSSSRSPASAIETVAGGAPSALSGAIVTTPVGEVPPNRRQAVVDLLQVRFAEDALSLGEYERRVAAAYQARTVADLDALVSDLHPQVSTAAPEYERIVTILSNNERSNSTPVPRRLEILCVLGNVELDLSSSIFAPGITEIDISSTLGNVEVTVPLGIRVEGAGNAILATFDCKVPTVVERYKANDRVIRISGNAYLASVQINALPARYSMEALPEGGAPRRLT